MDLDPAGLLFVRARGKPERSAALNQASVLEGTEAAVAFWNQRLGCFWNDRKGSHWTHRSPWRDRFSGDSDFLTCLA